MGVVQGCRLCNIKTYAYAFGRFFYSNIVKNVMVWMFNRDIMMPNMYAIAKG